jgi:REP element-mobilizing transposase RayT
LLGDETQNRKSWIEHRIQELADIFAISIGGFSVLDNHLHLLVRLDPALAQAWTDEEVVRRWARLFPPRDKAREPLAVSEDWVQARLNEDGWVAKARARLQSLSWFMKCLKEPLARMANRQDQTRGAFFEGRFKSVAILDDEALLTTCAYIELNPVAAGIAQLPETSEHTSIKQRVEHVQAQGRTDDLQAARGGSVAGSTAAGGLEESLWLCPIEDRRGVDSCREGMIEGFSLGNYLLLLDYTGRLFREGKATISREMAEILQRIGSSAETWQARLEQLKSRGSRLLGRFFAVTRDRLRSIAKKCGVHHLANLCGCLVA